MTQAAIALDFDQPPDVHLRLLAEIAFDAAFRFDGGAQVRAFLFRQILNLFRRVDVGLLCQLTRALLTDAIDRRKSDPKPLIRRQVHACNASHLISSLENREPGA